MFQPVQPYYTSLSSNAAYQPHPQNPNPSFSYPQLPPPYSQSSDPILQPPSTDPYGSLYAYPLTHRGIESQTVHYQPQVAVSESWVVKQADPVKYSSPAQNSLIEKSTVSISLNTVCNSSWTSQPNDASKKAVKQMKAGQPMQCEVCKIDCNSRDVFEKHIIGKKHKKNLYTYTLPATTLNQMNAMGEQLIAGTSGVATGGDLETKRCKLSSGGPPVDSVKFCTVCNIECNSQQVFNKHLAGRKHAVQAARRLVSGTQPLVATNPNPISCVNAMLQPLTKMVQKKKAKKAKVVQSAWCEVCKLNCNCTDIFNQHVLGKKHQKNTKKLEKARQSSNGPTAVAVNPIIGPAENPAASKSKTIDAVKLMKKAHPLEDLETKKLKIMESGAAVVAVKVCSLCNIVCNSETVFNSHLSGKKHLAKLKQAETGIASSGPQVSAPT